MMRIALVALLTVAAPALADPSQCESVRVDFTPTDSLQIVAWIEDAAGHYIDTVYVTRKVGHLGIGNRPGRFDLNSGPPPNGAKGVDDMAPYGRRITTFPVWAHRHGKTFPQVVFQNGQDDNVSHPVEQSSPESSPPFCRPVLPNADPATCQCKDPMMWDTGTCATQAFSDKGVFSPTATSLYPPRADLTPQSCGFTPACDSPSVAMYAALNVFDAVSHATPAAGTDPAIVWPAPPGLAPGDYVLWVELAREFDFNATYNPTAYPSPAGIPYGSYGAPYRGQPSVIYKAPFTVGPVESVGTSLDYVGYGDPTGADGTIRPPDATITTDTPGSGALRLELVGTGSSMYRLRVDAQPLNDVTPPVAPDQLAPTSVGSSSASLTFVAPGDDGTIGTVTGYDIRIQANTPLTVDNFATAMRAAATVVPVPAGQIQRVDVDGMLPETDYWVGIQAFDKCHNLSPIAIVQLTTAVRQAGTVDACFVATAAYGSMMANDVESLRNFRDIWLESNVLGELGVEAYYTFGPAVAGVVGESELLRTTARDALAPLVAWIRARGY